MYSRIIICSIIQLIFFFFWCKPYGPKKKKLGKRYFTDSNALIFYWAPTIWKALGSPQWIQYWIREAQPWAFYNLFWKEIIRTKWQQCKSDQNHTQEKHVGPSWGLSGEEIISGVKKRKRWVESRDSPCCNCKTNAPPTSFTLSATGVPGLCRGSLWTQGMPQWTKHSPRSWRAQKGCGRRVHSISFALTLPCFPWPFPVTVWR